ncbi:MAG: hypothetical protein KHY83_06465 [Coriobacteriia bacterium]|nr:hypothetical protein [Coriobacteriia bacterium]MBS5478291.1 hypothetical protein [Coriobacteriia bacterium]
MPDTMAAGTTPRLTSRGADGSYATVSDATSSAFLDRLGRHEDVLEALRAEYDDALAKIERLRVEGRVHTATYRQLVANRITLKSVLERYADAGL